MPVSDEMRPYDKLQDPGNPSASPPHWSVIAGMLITVISAGLTAALGAYDTLRTDPLKAALIVGLAMTAAAASVLGVAFMQGKKEVASTEGAAKVTEAKIEAKAAVQIAQATGQPPPPEVAVVAGAQPFLPGQDPNS